MSMFMSTPNAVIPPDLVGIPIVPTLPEAVTARAAELLRLYRTLAPRSTCARDAIAKACVRLACSEHVLPIDLKSDLLVKSNKQTLAFNHAQSSVLQRVPSLSKTASADGTSLAMILVKLGAVTVDRDFAHQLAAKMLEALRREGEVTGSTPQSWIDRVELEYQCAAAYVQMKQQKSQVSLASFETALKMPKNKFDAVVARLQMELREDLEARFRPRTPTKNKGRKRARQLLGGAGSTTGEEDEDDELVAPATAARQPPSLSLTRPLSSATAAARKRPRLASPMDAPQCELTATDSRAASALSSSSSSSKSALALRASATPASTFQPIRRAATPASTRRPKPSAASTPLTNALAPVPPPPAPQSPPRHDLPATVCPRLGIGFYSMIPLTHPCKTARFQEYLDWREAMQGKLTAAIQQGAGNGAEKGTCQDSDDDDENDEENMDG